MNFKATGVLLALLIVVGGFVIWQDRQTPPPNQAKATQIIDVQDKDISGLNISYQGQSLALKRNGSQDWQITQPEQANADFLTVETVTGKLSNLNATRVLTGTVGAPSDYGLDKPIAEVNIKEAQGKTDALIVGGKTPDDNSYYVKRGDSDSIYLVATSTISDVVKLVTNPPKATPTLTPAPPTPNKGASTPTPAPTTPTPVSQG